MSLQQASATPFLEVHNFAMGPQGPIKTYLPGVPVGTYRFDCTVQSPGKKATSVKGVVAMHTPQGVLLTTVAYTKAGNIWLVQQTPKEPITVEYPTVMDWLLSPMKAPLPPTEVWDGITPLYNHRMLSRWKAIKTQFDKDPEHFIDTKFYNAVKERTATMAYDKGHPSLNWSVYSDVDMSCRLFVLVENKWVVVKVDVEEDRSSVFYSDEASTLEFIGSSRWLFVGMADEQHGFRAFRLHNDSRPDDGQQDDGDANQVHEGSAG